MKQKPIVRFLPIILLISLIFGCISISASILSTVHRQNTKKMRENTLEELQKRTSDLQKNLEFVQSAEFIEEEAREKLNMAKPGETIILINQPEQGTGNPQETMNKVTNWKSWWALFFE